MGDFRSPLSIELLERQLESKLDVTVIVKRVAVAALHGIDSCRRAYVRASQGESQNVKILVVGEVIELSPELQFKTLSDCEILVDSKVQVPVTRRNEIVAVKHVRWERASLVIEPRARGNV